MKKLTKTELIKSELFSKRKRANDLEAKVMKLEMQILDLQFEIRRRDHNLAITKRKEMLSNKESKNEKSSEEHKKFNEKLKDKYKIKDSFGINHDTGEIIES